MNTTKTRWDRWVWVGGGARSLKYFTRIRPRGADEDDDDDDEG